MDPVLLVGIISGGSAIVASVGAQLVNAAVSRRHEARRLDLEERRLRLQIADANRIRFEDVKREAFADFLYHADAVGRDLDLFFAPRLAPIVLLGLDIKLVLSISRHLDAASRRMQEILLLDPSMRQAFADYQRTVPSVRGLAPILKRDKFQQDYLAGIRRLREAMQISLGIEQDLTKSHTRPQLNEAPKSGDSNKPGPTT